MGFVDDAEVVLGKKVEEGKRARAGGASGEVARIVFDPCAEAHFFHHLEVELGAHFQALRFEEFALRLELGEASVEFGADCAEGAPEFVLRGDELFGGENGQAGDGFIDVAGQRIEEADAVDIVAEEFHADGFLVHVGRVDLDDVATDAEFAAAEGDVIAGVEEVDEASKEGFAREVGACREREEHLLVVFRRGETVDARHAGHDEDVAAGEQGAGGGEAEALDLLVDRGIFFDVGVGARDVGLRLVVVEVADEIFDRIVGEELFEFRVKLRSEGFVVRDDQRGAVEVADDVGRGEGFARARDAEQRLVAVTRLERTGELFNSRPLVAARCVGGGEAEGHGGNFQIRRAAGWMPARGTWLRKNGNGSTLISSPCFHDAARIHKFYG